MSDRATVMVVEDDEIMRTLLESALGDLYDVISVGSGEACLERFAKERPRIILLDIEMPGIDGYETCRQIKDHEGVTPPVVFISSRDRLEDRLKGYDAGGEDYILKPVAFDELLTKVALRLKAAADHAQLKQMADYASQTAMTAMSSMGEMGVLLQTLQRFNRCVDLDELAASVVQALAEYSLNGMVRLRTTQELIMRSNQGAVSPIEESIIEQVAAMGRIVEYRSRMSVSYEHVVLLVTNAPQDDEDRRGRLRDHLAVLAEGAQVSMLAIHRGIVIKRVLQQTNQALICIQDSERDMHVGTSLALQDMTDKLEQAYTSVGLSEKQEDFLAGIVSGGIEHVRREMDIAAEVLPLLTAAIEELSMESAG